MFTTMRRHAGWSLKIVLGVIIVSFVFFFGLSSLQEQRRGGEALRVGKEMISRDWFQFFYDQTLANFRQNFKGESFPPFLLRAAQDNARQRVVYRTLSRQFCKQMGFVITDKELARYITSRQKDFDPIAYKNFLQNFFHQNRFSYEDLIREELLLQKFQQWSQRIEKIPPEDSSDNKKTKKKEVTRSVGAPVNRLVDLWFRDYVAKVEVKSYLPTETL